jgi:hypothetical protein
VGKRTPAARQRHAGERLRSRKTYASSTTVDRTALSAKITALRLAMMKKSAVAYKEGKAQCAYEI